MAMQGAQLQALRLQQAEAKKKRDQELKELREHVHDEVVNAAAVSPHYLLLQFLYILQVLHATKWDIQHGTQASCFP